MQRDLPGRQNPAPVPADVHDHCEVSVSEIAGRPVRTLAPRSRRTGVHLVHLHGGAYVYSAQEAHWRALARLAGASGATIHVPLYGLAPGATVDDAFPLLDAVISTVGQAEEGSRVLLSGDSAGGGLAMAQALRMRDLRHLPVDGILLFSPWVDVALDNPEIDRLERRDPMLSRRMLVQAGRWWAGERDVSDPFVSPLRGDLTGLLSPRTSVVATSCLLTRANSTVVSVRREVSPGCGNGRRASTFSWPH